MHIPAAPTAAGKKQFTIKFGQFIHSIWRPQTSLCRGSWSGHKFSIL